MNWRQWSCFLEVAKTRSYSKAADNLYLSQSVVSYHVMNLEKDLGVKLFHRDSHSVALTDAGLSLYEQLSLHFSAIETCIETFKEKKKKHILQIASTYILNYKMFFSVFEEFKKIHPNVEILTAQMEPEEVLDALSEGKIDLCFAIEEEAALYPNLTFFPMFSIRRNGVLIPAEDPLAKRSCLFYRDLAGKTIILPEDISRRPRLHYFLRKAESLKKNTRIIYVPDMLTAYTMVSEGKGVCPSIDFLPNTSRRLALSYCEDEEMAFSGICFQTDGPVIYAKELARLLRSSFSQI